MSKHIEDSECALYGCGEGYWTREDVDELQGALDDTLNPKDIYITHAYINEDSLGDFFDIEFHFIFKGQHYYSGLFQNIKIDRCKASTAEELIKVYAPILAEAIETEINAKLPMLSTSY